MISSAYHRAQLALTLTREAARRRADGCRSAAENCTTKANDFRAIAEAATDPETRRIALAFAAIAKREVMAEEAHAAAYDRVAKGGEP